MQMHLAWGLANGMLVKPALLATVSDCVHRARPSLLEQRDTPLAKGQSNSA
eukprot:CAMPEP_0195102768 /NCGR_PEP_ID=MMETSP0448-20130528/69361_1 /TAXON_ID=66468 /ORGANISM="Heterocapsa triquestra, Strain CCMP 448" /LENGTH=50 /DNA_ID=CAMNT_0040138319 /DNA_START=124 /DNA_END=272 /DNA_ORIENTATION=+